MKKFQIFRYLSKWKYLIILIAIVGSVLVYWYGNRNQSYTATAIMEYTNEGAAEGLNPDGSAIDSSEIISAAVITDVISELGLQTNVESIRSRCSVREVIPTEELEKRESALKLGNEYEYFPTTYQVSFTVGSSSSKDYARDVLDSILTNYFSLYCEKYIDYAVFPNNATNITTDKYDYIDCVEMLESTAEEISYYLDQRASIYPEFRSAITGYSFSDLKDSYQNIQDNVIPRLYAYILNNRLVIDKELLLKRYENNKAQYEIEIANYDAHIQEAKSLLDQFGDKTLEKNDLNYSFGGGNGSNDGLIINNVEDYWNKNAASNQVETTYDQLINQYVTLQSKRIGYQTKLGKCEEILAIYQNDEIANDKESDQAQAAISAIEDITGQLNGLYASILPTIEEFNEKNGADNLSMLSSISVKEKFNMNIYLMLAVLFFLIVGCFVAIFCGRVADFIEYFMYTDKKTGLPNRNRCDIAIEQYEEKLLPEHFVCLVFKVNLQYSDRPEYTRRDGDHILTEFGGFAKHVLEEAAFVGYNNDGMFISFIENCSFDKARVLTERMQELVENYNTTQAIYPIVYYTGICETSTDNIYSARSLLRTAIKKAMQSLRDAHQPEDASKESAQQK